MEHIGSLIDKLIWFGAGIYFIFLSVKSKERLGDKASLVRFGGIILIVVGIVFTSISLLNN